MRKLKFILAVLFIATVVTSGLWAQGAKFQIPIQEHRLGNGLRIILSEDHSAPTYSIALTYDVGSRNERKGRTGFAHLFEHMMFQGSENVGKGEHFILVFNNGGSMNGTTNQDRTNYFETFPSNQLDLGLFLEADRMRSLAITQENLDNQRKAVQEERRLSIDNRPYGKTFEAISDTAYDNFAYKHSTIGSMADLDAATVEDVAGFFKMYYAPNNAVLTLVGDFDSQEALNKIEKYFGDIPQQPDPPPVDMTEPEQQGERRLQLEDKFARLPLLVVVYKVPPGGTQDFFALDLMGDVLMRGRSSRLYQKLVREKQVAVQVFGGPQESRGTSLMMFGAVIAPGKDPAEVEKLIYEEIDRIKTEPVEAWEVDKIRLMNRRAWAQRLQGTLSRASLIGQYTVYFNDPEYLAKREGYYQRVSLEDIQRVTRTFLKQSNRSVITTIPKPPQAPAQKDGR